MVDVGWGIRVQSIRGQDLTIENGITFIAFGEGAVEEKLRYIVAILRTTGQNPMSL